MSMTFTKLFSSITESTIWLEPTDTRIVWVCMLAMADRKGRIWASVPGLANRARVSVEACRKALDAFLSPDADSRTKDHEGRRIAPIDGGWVLLNYQKYRDIRDAETTKEQTAERVRKHREKKRNVTPVTRGNHNEEAEAELSTSLRSVDKRASRLPATWAPVIHNDWEYQQLEVFRDYWKSQPGQKGVKADWDATWRNWLRRAKDYDAKQHPRKQSAVDRVRQACNLDADGFPVGTDDGDVRAQVGEQLRGKPKRGVVEGDFRIVDGAD